MVLFKINKVSSSSKKAHLLSIVYFFVLVMFIMPHHHHEEMVCYTKVHCESEANEESHHNDEHADHSHDHSPGEQTQNCMALEYYVKSDFGKDNKKLIQLNILDFGVNKFKIFDVNPLKDKILTVKEKQFEFLDEQNNYVVFIRKNLPLRAPPALA